jgi:serine/threonine protein phosphatase PrpC
MYKSYQVNNFSLTDVGNARSNNEDYFGSMQLRDGNLFIVCDGMGAHQAGEQASTMCVNLIKEYFSSQATGNPSIDLYNAIIFANEQIFVAAQMNEHLKGMGTTVVTLLITQNEIHIGHVGDSRMYLFSDNHLYQLTKDHSFVQGLVDQGLISKDEMERHSRKNELTNAIGIFQQVKPTISKSPLKAKVNDKFLLCSDGLNGMISDEDISNEMKKEQGIDAMCVNLISRAKIAGGIDNITVSCVEIQQSPFNVTNLDGVGFYNFDVSQNSKNLLKSVWFQFLLGLSFLIFLVLGYLIYTGDLSLWPFSSKDDTSVIDLKRSENAEDDSISLPDERDKVKDKNFKKDNNKNSIKSNGKKVGQSNNKTQAAQKNKVNNLKGSATTNLDSSGRNRNNNFNKNKDTSSQKGKSKNSNNQKIDQPKTQDTAKKNKNQ